MRSAGLDVLPEAAVRRAVHAGDRARGCWSRRQRDAADLRDQLASLLLESARQRRRVGCARAISRRADDQAALEQAGFLRRHDCRFQWHNRGYRDFDDFLDGFTRRQAQEGAARAAARRRSRHRVPTRCTATTSTPALWRTIFGFSERTFLRHGNAHYLNAEFFERVAARMPGTSRW